MKLGELKKVEPDEIEKLILKWRERAKLMRRIWASFEQNSPTCARYEAAVTELEQCAKDLELAHIGPDPIDVEDDKANVDAGGDKDASVQIVCDCDKPSIQGNGICGNCQRITT